MNRYRSNPDRLAEFVNAARRLAAERGAAELHLPHLIRDTPANQWPALAERADVQTCGALHVLSSLISHALTTDPQHALQLAGLAVSAATAIPGSKYAAVLLAQYRAMAWKDYGKALRTLSRYEAALAAFEHAESLIVPQGVLPYDLAGIRFNVAVTLQELGRFDESLVLLQECKEIYRDLGDTKTLVNCSIAEGVLLQRIRRYREARETLLLILAAGHMIEKVSLAALHHAIGFCSIELRDFSSADANLKRAIELHHQLGHDIEALKADAGRGRLYICRGDIIEGIDHLRPIRRQFLMHGMPEEAGICGLEIVEGMLTLEKRSSAAMLARRILHEFTNARLSTRAITALGYLTEAIQGEEATGRTAAHVREYILSLRTEPEREFRAP